MRLHQTDAHLGYACLHLALPAPDPTQARAHLTEARALITATGYHRRDAELARLEALLQARPPSADEPARARRGSTIAVEDPHGIAAVAEVDLTLLGSPDDRPPMGEVSEAAAVVPPCALV